MMGADFLMTAFVYLSVAVIAVPIAQRFGLGSVLGYLFAGILIGPFVLGLVGDQNTDVLHFAEFGVVMMLFVIGLELEPAMLWNLRRKILGLGGLQVLLSTIGIAMAGYFFGLSWQMAVAVGMILALSSTAIVMQSLDEKGWRKTPGGNSSFTVLLFQDIAVIPILALLPLLATLPMLTGYDAHHGAGNGDGHGNGHGDGHAADAAHAAAEPLIASLPPFAQGLAPLVAIVAIILLGRFLLRPVFRFIASMHSRELFTAFALFLVIGIAVLFREIGLSMALGTFLAGVVLADSQYRHELENNIEPFKGLLLGLFFISVGAGIDFGLVFGQLQMVLGLTLGLILLKLLVLLVLGFGFGLRGSQLALFTLSLAQGGEFAFVLFSFATQNGVLGLDVTAPLTAVVALSMLLTPALLIIYERILLPILERAANAQEPDEIDDETPEVLLLGYGAFGTLVGRFMMANRIKTTILDVDPNQIDVMRRFGFKVYYGDATRLDLLELAGLADAKVLVVTIGDKEACTHIVAEVRHHYPDKVIVARAGDRAHYAELKKAGATVIIRQYMQSALEMGYRTLTELGMRKHQAYRRSRAFEQHDIDLLYRTTLAETDEDRLKLVQSARQEIEDMLNDDKDFDHEVDTTAWENKA